MLKLLLLLASVGYISAQKSYADYKVFRTEALDKHQASMLSKLMIESYVDFWSDPRVGRSSDIMVAPTQVVEVESLLNTLNIEYTEMIDDVDRAIRQSTLKQNDDDEMNWVEYHSFKTINEYIDGLAKKYSDWVKTVSIGKTYEGRDMRVIQISKAGPEKPIVWMEAGIHAREWIASAVCTYVINQLVEHHENHTNILESINFHILPNANPDGYEYTRNRDRLWRKTRSKNPGSVCRGTDPNRNWEFHWAETGVSHNPCSDVYCGPKPFSEIETRNVRDYVLKFPSVPILSHCFHSYSQLWLWPYGYAYDEYPENKEEVKLLAEEAAEALKAVHGTVFDPINSAELYPAAGASDDWYKGVLGSRFAYTTELRDTGTHGFVLPKGEIIPSGEEIWAGLEVVFKKIIALTS